MKRRLCLISFTCIFFVSAVCYAAFDSADFSKAKPLEINRITPDGNDVPAFRQIVIQFNQPVVPLGRMERNDDEVPITLTPAVKGQWRWLNTSALALQLDETHALDPSTRYTLTIRPEPLNEAGQHISQALTHTFITERPRISYKNFYTWRAPGLPVIRLTFNQPVTKTSIENHLFIRYGENKTLKAGLMASPDSKDYEKPRYVRTPGDPYRLDFGPQAKEKSDDQAQNAEGVEARRVWLVEPHGELPEDMEVELWSEPGIVSALGPETGVENAMVVRFATFPSFRFVGVEFWDHDKKDNVSVSADNPADAKKLKADPLSSVYLVFSAPVTPDAIKEALAFKPDLAGGRTDYDPWAGSYYYSYLQSSHQKGNLYRIRIPELLKAAQEYTITETVFNLKDEFGRLLKKPVNITFYTDHRLPDYYLTHHFGVLEDQVPTDVPLVITNLEKIKVNYKTLTADGTNDKDKITFKPGEAMDVAYFYPLGVRQMLGSASGAVYGSIDSDPYVEKYESDRTFFTQVTPFQVFAKIGHFNSLVWVTSLSDGKPVKDATVSFYKGEIDNLEAPKNILAKGTTDGEGRVLLPGNEALDPRLAITRWGWYQDDVTRLMVHVVKDGKMALLPVSPEFEVDTWRVSNYSVSSGNVEQYGHIHTWGTTAQGVYRAGDTIQYKIYVRNQDNQSFVAPPLSSYTLNVIDPMGKNAFTLSGITLSQFGAFDGEFTVPKTGAVGWYRFELASSFSQNTWSPMEVLVSDFTPSPFRVTSELSGDRFKNGDKVDVTTLARLHAGGPYVSAGTRVTARLQESWFSASNPVAQPFYFDTHSGYNRDKTVFEEQNTLDDKGDLTSTFTLNEPDFIYGHLLVESNVQDDRGKYVSSMNRADYFGRTRLVGLKSERWVYEQNKPAVFQFIVVNDKGDPEPGVKTVLHAEYLETKASRVKGAGNAYLTHYTHEWKTVDTFQTDSRKTPLPYSFTPTESGSYKIVAEINDTKGLSHKTETRTWVIGPGQVVWEQPEGNSLEIIPESEDLKVGDTARYLIKNPYPGATALVSLERYGVLKSWTQVLETGTPVIEFPVTEETLPGFFLSVTVISPRVETAPEDTGEVDLGKPTFKTGYVSVTVKDPYKAIDVTVKPEHTDYRPGDKVNVSLTAKPSHPSGNEPVELAVAVLDEAVFDLLSDGRGHFDPYAGFYSVDGLDLMNYSLLTQLIGIQKFEKKGASPGGDGGAEISMRSVFDYVSYWNPSLVTDGDGRADISFTVPDNLTGWRVFAMAVTPSDRMGLGDEGFKVNLPTELRAVMPNQVTEGDEFKAGFTIMNRTDKTRTLSVSINVTGPLDPESPRELTQKITCQPYKRLTEFLTVKTGMAGELKFTATAKDAIDGDGLVHVVPVNVRRNLETAATYETTTQDRVDVHIEVPENIYTDVGAISVRISPTIIGNIAGAFEYMKNYPYACWEQKLSKGVMAAQYLRLKPYLPEDVSWDNAQDLVLKTLEEAANFQTPSGAMAYYIPSETYDSPYLSAYTSLAFGWLKKSGYTIPDSVESRLLSYLDSFLKRDAQPDFYTKGMSATVRAVALNALAENGILTLKDLKRYESHVPYMDLFGKAMFMQAALKTRNAEKLSRETCTMILAHAGQTGGKFMFSETKDDSFTRILASPIRDNAAILSAFLMYGETDEGKTLVADIPFKLVRALTQARGSRDHWENTQENLFCMNALTDYARIYENQKPDMKVKAYVDNVRIGKTDFTDYGDEAQTYIQNLTADDPGMDKLLSVFREGEGRLYFSPRISYALFKEHEDRVNAGVDIRKEISVERKGAWVLLNRDDHLTRGELVRVDLYVSLPAPRNFLVVDDPVSGGLEPVNRDLATASQFDAEKGDFIAAGGAWWFSFSDWYEYSVSRWSFYHKELRHDSVRYYSDYLPAGNYHLSYTAQAIAEGEFAVLPVSAVEMYDPDVYGKGLTGSLTIGEKTSDEK